MLWTVLMTCLGFLSGAIMYSYLLPKGIKHIDIRQSGADGNPGGTNAVSSCGLLLGVSCMILDVLKGFVPVFLAISWLHIRGDFLIPIIIAPVLGHAFSPLLKFRGGKAVATSYGVILATIQISYLVWIVLAVSIVLQFVIVLRPNSAKTIAIFAGSALLAIFLEPQWAMKLSMLLIASVVVPKHILNPNAEPFRILILKKDLTARLERYRGHE